MKINNFSQIVERTVSLCPICFKRVNAKIVKKKSEYFIEKTCPEHGFFSAVIWRGLEPDFSQWSASTGEAVSDTNSPGCIEACGLCENHLQKTCCALVEITNSCNLSCPICFAQSNEENVDISPSVADLKSIFKDMAAQGNTFIQLSGGEPTLRDDLPEIIEAAKEVGAKTVQLNSNGLLFAKNPELAKSLREAGLDFVFMQFDGTDDDIYLKLRGEKLLDLKKKAIEVCGLNKIGVTLVPTIVPEVNDDNIGSIIDFALSNSPIVRGVHFQPISYFGRYPETVTDKDRITLPEVLQQIIGQTDGKFALSDFNPSSCDHPRCGFHGDFAVLPKGELLKLTKKTQDCCKPNDAHLKSRNFVARRWSRSEGEPISDEDADMQNMDNFLSRVKSHGFTITAMAFQDADTIDLSRLRHCSLHVAKKGKIVPFCANYLTAVVK